jgi:hypothetical protein
MLMRNAAQNVDAQCRVQYLMRNAAYNVDAQMLRTIVGLYNVYTNHT